MSNVLKMLSRGGAAAAETDPNFKQTVLLLHGDGTNGAQNNTFLDSSTNNFTITRNGNTTQGTFSPFSLAAGEWSNYFDGNGDFLSIAYNAALDITNANFCVEAWIYRTTSGVEQYLISQRAGNGWEWRINATNLMVFFYTAGSSITSVSTIPVNQWTHVAVTRDGSNVRLFINGVVDATATFSNGTATTSSLRIGYTTDPPAGYFQGYLSNVRVVKGSAVYTSAFTPSTTPLTAITNTSLLTCQSNRFVDNSTNNFTITRNGDVRVTPFSPFAPTAAYSAGTNGGSGYFDGSGDYLTAPAGSAFAYGTGAFTLEAWVYPTVSGLDQMILTQTVSGTNYLQWGISPSNIPFFTFALSGGGTSISSSTAVTINAWNHIAVVREGTGTNQTKIYLNGTNVATGTCAQDFTNTTYVPTIGRYTHQAILHFNGYIADLRVVKGTAVYTSAFTPSNTPLTNITNTSLLLNFTNAGIFDNTGKNNLETVGNAQIDITTKKYGTGSLEFDGNGDILVARNIELLDFPSGDFTVEFWYNTNTLTPTGPGTAGYGFIVGKTNWNGTNSGAGWSVFQFNQTIVFFHPGSTLASIATGNVITATNTWYHIAVVRSGTATNNTKIYINGVQQAQGTPTITSSTQPLVVGEINTSYGWDIRYSTNGFIDDLRITKGVARYTANFTAPTKEFPDQ